MSDKSVEFEFHCNFSEKHAGFFSLFSSAVEYHNGNFTEKKNKKNEKKEEEEGIMRNRPA